MSNYLNILARLTNTPLLIAEAKLDIITNAVILPLAEGRREDIPTLPSMSTGLSKTPIQVPQQIAVLEVFDSLVSKEASAASGMTSYQRLSRKIDYYAANGATHMVFWIDSPGGEVSGLFGLTSQIRGLAKKGIQTIGFIDGMGTSAAYAIAAACGKTYASETSIAASIATIMVTLDMTAADKKAGIKYHIYRSKEEKALGNAHEVPTELVVNKFNAILASIDNSFNNDILVSKKKLSLETIINLKGSEVMAEEGLKLGLIDGIYSNISEVISSFSAKTNKQVLSTSTTDLSGKSMTPVTLEDALQIIAEQDTKIAALSAELQAAGVKLSETITTMAEEKTLAIAAEQTRCLGILAAADPLRLPATVAIDHIKANTSEEGAKSAMVMVASHMGAKIDGSAGFAGAPDVTEPDRSEKVNSLRQSYTTATGKKFPAK